MRYSCNPGRSVKFLIGASIAAVLLGVSALPASAQTADAAPKDPVIKTKGGSYSGKRYFVEFRARNAATYGHMYVLYGRVNGRDEIVQSRIAGLHPAGDAENCNNCSVLNWTIGHLIFVPSETGASDGDLEEKYVTARYRIWMDRAHYKELDSYIRKLQADSPVWNALWNNCVGFGRNIAEHIGLKIPLLVWLEPKDFVTSLREMNGLTKEQLPLKDASTSGRSSASRTPPLPPQKPKAEPAAGQPTVSTLPKPAPAKPKKPVAQNAALQAVASSGNAH